ncbi:MAG: helix-turn-helix transcriptional regulator [Oscillospiraceae bacterium]|nr:helix-turn-helix transcriptional regulator [Oscillospiraceae bacterium]
MATNYVVAIPALLLALALWALFIYVVVLIVRALRKYLRSNQEGKSPPEQIKSLGEALKARRTQRGFTQEYVAEALGVSRQAVSKWENGSSEPSTANLMALAKLYGLSVDELLHSAE